MLEKLNHSVSLGSLVREQISVAAKVRFQTVSLRKIRKICGVDVSYSKDKSVACAVVWDREAQSIVETSVHKSVEDFPYIPGFLFKREFRQMVRAVNQLRSSPDLLLVDGHGMAHPRRAGLAVFVGVALQLPTVGVAKSMLTGMVDKREGPVSPILVEGEKVGWFIHTQGSRKYYLSPGNLVRVDDLPPLASLWNYGYPNVLRYADKLSRKEAFQQ